MADKPVPFVVTTSSDAADAPHGAVPVAFYGGTGGDVSVAWDDVTGKPSTFAPAAHTHDIDDVTGLQAIITDLTSRIEALESAGA